MNLCRNLAFSILLFAGLAGAQQNFLTQTTLTNAISNSQQSFLVASTAGITVTPVTDIYVDLELMQVMGVTGNLVTVQRAMAPTRASTHAVGEMILAGHPDWFYTLPAIGSCPSIAQVYVLPYVQVTNGTQWLCSTLTGIWAPGWSNTLEPPTTSAAVASAAGVVLPTGPLFHMTGTNAVTGFTLPLGFTYGFFTIIPDGAWTTTNAGNIAVASTAVVGKPLTFTYDSNTSKFYPSY